MLPDTYMDADLIEENLAETLPASGLTWPGASAEQLRFMQRVYDINLQRNVASGRPFVADVSNADLGTIEGRYLARTAAAADCVRLLAAVRRDIINQNRPVQVGLTSAYRSASEQFRLWQQYFTEPNGYYERTATQRRNQPDGEHSEAAAQQTAAFVRGRIGTPGFSNHNNGLAVDFLNVVNGSNVPNRTTDAATQQWRQSWFWDWLVANAQTYNFYQNTAINEPWHWEYRAPVVPPPRPAEIADVWGADLQTANKPSIWDEEDELDNRGLSETGGGTFRRLREQDVHYLSFEGGGGKGFVYTGAIRALQDKGILRFPNGRLDPTGPIKGISGASAGAITAMLLSIGYDADAITRLMRSNNFNRFFDLPAIPSRIPQINGCRNGSNNLAIRALEGILRAMLPIIIPINIGGIRERAEEFINRQLESFFRNRIQQSDSGKGPASKLAAYPLHYINDIVADMGVFSGCTARNFFNQLLIQKSGQPNLTFRQHFELFRIRLVLTGSNLERGTSESFSADTTPNMPVADAVRISMGLPFIFKPYRISVQSATAMGNPALAGLWVDGGVRNNLPIRAFENAPESRPHTLGIRLGEEPVRRIDSVLDMLTALTVHQGLMGSGEADISQTSGYQQQTVILSTSGLSLIDFSPPAAVVDPLIETARTAIARYFDPRIPQPEGLTEWADNRFYAEDDGATAPPQMALTITWRGVNNGNLAANVVLKSEGSSLASGSGTGSFTTTVAWKKNYRVEIRPTTAAPNDLYILTVTTKRNSVAKTATGTQPLTIAVGNLNVQRENWEHVKASWRSAGVDETKARDMVSATLLGKRIRINRRVLPRAQRTQAAFDALPTADLQRIIDSIATIGGYNLRTQSGTTGAFSNHSIGSAMDINYNSDTFQNHHFKKDPDLKILDLVEAVVRTQTGQQTFDIGSAQGVAQLAASQLFNNIFSQWLYDTLNRLAPETGPALAEIPSPRSYSAQRLKRAVDAATAAGETALANHLQTVSTFQLKLAAWVEGADLNGIRLYGMIPLDRQFLEIMLANGWEWGGDYRRSNKDYMHFEDIDAKNYITS